MYGWGGVVVRWGDGRGVVEWGWGDFGGDVGR
jgi:hypothetical protein